MKSNTTASAAPMTSVNLAIPAFVLAKAKQMARLHGLTLDDYAQRALCFYIGGSIESIEMRNHRRPSKESDLWQELGQDHDATIEARLLGVNPRLVLRDAVARKIRAGVASSRRAAGAKRSRKQAGRAAT